MENELGLQSGPGAGAGDPLSGLLQQHDHLESLHNKVTESVTKMDKLRLGLGKLAKMGDTVTQDDVIGEAGELVAHGLDPMAIASVLADMPQDGQPLAQWVTQRAQAATQKEQQLLQGRDQVQTQLGAQALKIVMAHAATQAQPGMYSSDQSGPAQGANELMPGSPQPMMAEESSNGR